MAQIDETGDVYVVTGTKKAKESASSQKPKAWAPQTLSFGRSYSSSDSDDGSETSQRAAERYQSALAGGTDLDGGGNRQREQAREALFGEDESDSDDGSLFSAADSQATSAVSSFAEAAARSPSASRASSASEALFPEDDSPGAKPFGDDADDADDDGRARAAHAGGGGWGAVSRGGGLFGGDFSDDSDPDGRSMHGSESGSLFSTGASISMSEGSLFND